MGNTVSDKTSFKELRSLGGGLTEGCLQKLMKQRKSPGWAGGNDPEQINTATLQGSLAQLQLQQLQELENYGHPRSFFLYVTFWILKTGFNIWKQVLIPETLSASSRVGTSQRQVLFEISASTRYLCLCPLLQSWQRARALCSEQRRDSGVPLICQDQIFLLACIEVNKFLQHTLGKGTQRSEGGMPLIQHLSITERGGWELRLLWMFLY